MANIGAQKQFALVVDSVTKEPRRLIDTSDDPDDQHLLFAQQNVAADETFILLNIADYPVRKPYVVAAALGYVAPAVVVPAPDPVETQAVADITPRVGSLSASFRLALRQRIRELWVDGNFTTLPRNDPQIRSLLAAEVPAALAIKLTNNAPEAKFYIAAVVRALWAQVGV